MAGRGTDIKLEDGVAELGGLKIIGTESHESDELITSYVVVPVVRETQVNLSSTYLLKMI